MFTLHIRRHALALALALALPAAMAARQPSPMLTLPPPVLAAIDTFDPAKVSAAIIANGHYDGTLVVNTAVLVARAAEAASQQNEPLQRTGAAITGALAACVQFRSGPQACREVVDKAAAMLVPPGEMARYQAPLMESIYPAVVAEATRIGDPALILKTAQAALTVAANLPDGPALDVFVPPGLAMLARADKVAPRDRLVYCFRLNELIQAQRSRRFKDGFATVIPNLVRITTQPEVFMVDPGSALVVLHAVIPMFRYENFRPIASIVWREVNDALTANLPKLEPLRPGVYMELMGVFNDLTRTR